MDKVGQDHRSAAALRAADLDRDSVEYLLGTLLAAIKRAALSGPFYLFPTVLTACFNLHQRFIADDRQSRPHAGRTRRRGVGHLARSMMQFLSISLNLIESVRQYERLRRYLRYRSHNLRRRRGELNHAFFACNRGIRRRHDWRLRNQRRRQHDCFSLMLRLNLSLNFSLRLMLNLSLNFSLDLSCHYNRRRFNPDLSLDWRCCRNVRNGFYRPHFAARDLGVNVFSSGRHR